MTEIVNSQSVPAIIGEAPSSAAVLDVIVRAASDPNIDVAKMERLMAMHKQLRADQAEAEFNDAMRRAQEGMTHIREDADNPSTRSKYASYVALDKVARPIYVSCGFSVSFGQGDGAPEAHVRVVADVAHRGGHLRQYHADIPADGKGAKGGDVMTKTHATGSAFSYGRRYLLALIFNLVVSGMEDDDGNGASGSKISAAQKEALLALQKTVSADTAAFLKFFKVKTLDDLPASRFKEAKDMLERKSAQQRKGAPQQ